MNLQHVVNLRASAVTAMHALVELAEEEDRGLTAEEREKWDGMNADIEGYDQRIKDIRTAEKYHNQVDQYLEDEQRNKPPKPSGRGEGANGNGGEGPDSQKEWDERYEATFDKFVRFGAIEMSGEERSILRQGIKKLEPGEARAQGVGTDAAGGYTVPRGFSGFIEDALLDYSGIRRVAGVFRTTTGNDLPFPTNNDTGNAGAILAENTQDSEQDLVFAELILGAYKYTSKIIRVSVELMQDSAFNMDAYIGGKFGERLGRATAAHYATGTGTGQPNGLITAATVGKTAASGTAVTYLEMLDLKHSVDPAYRRRGANWLFNDTTLKALKQLVDLDGRPLWSPSVAADAPATFDGDPYEIDQGIASIGLSAKPIAYGDTSKYLIRDVRDFTMVRLSERYADFHQVGFIAFMRTDADLLDAGTNPIKVLQMAAA